VRTISYSTVPFIADMRRTLYRDIPVFVASLALSACVSYTPAPLDTGEIVQQRLSASLDPAAVAEEYARLAPGQEWDGVSWDRLSLLAAALVTSPEIARARAAVDSAEASARAAEVRPGPTLGLTAEYTSNAPEASPWLLGVAADLPLDFGTRRETRIDSATLNARIAQFDYLDTAWSVRLRIRNQLAASLLAEQQLAQARELAALRRQQTEAMQHQVDAGEASRAELERVRADGAADLKRLSDAEARAVTARAELAAAVGVPAEALGELPLSWPGVGAPTSLAADLPGNCLTAALLARPDVARASRAYDQAELAVRRAVAEQYPSISIGPGYTWERGLHKLPFGLNLGLPPLDGNRAAIEAAEAQRLEAGRALEATVAAASGAAAIARSGYDAAWAALERAREQEQIAAHLAAQADASLAAGAIGRVDWTAAQAGLRNARLDEIAAVLAVREAESSLEDALRRPLEGPELLITPKPSPTEEKSCAPRS